MAAPKKAAVNTPMSRLLKANPNFAKKVKENMPKQKAKPTSANATATNLLKKKGAVDKAKAIVKSGRSNVTAGYKELRTPQYASDKQVTYDKIAMGEKEQKVGRVLARRAAQPYGEAVRTNARVQAQAKKAAKKTK
jgi:hypothetical protein